MRLIFLFLFTIIFVLDSQAKELTYSTKILYNAEYTRLESTLTNLVDKIKTYRSNIESAQKTFNESRNLLELMFVFALEDLHKNNKKSQFGRITQILDNENLRNNIYYPVSRMSGFSKKTLWIKIGDEKCINLIPEKEIESGLFVNVEVGAFEHLGIGDRYLQFKDVYINAQGKTVSYVLAHFEYKKGASIGPIAEAFTKEANDSVRYYNCDYIHQYEETEALYDKATKRYLYLAKILDRSPKDFETEKKAETLSEIFNGLTSDVPNQKAVNLEAEENKMADKAD